MEITNKIKKCLGIADECNERWGHVDLVDKIRHKIHTTDFAIVESINGDFLEDLRRRPYFKYLWRYENRIKIGLMRKNGFHYFIYLFY